MLRIINIYCSIISANHSTGFSGGGCPILVTTRIMFILIGVSLLSVFLTATALPAGLAKFLIQLDIQRGRLITLAAIFFILLGCIMNVAHIILLTMPTILPAVTALGTDPYNSVRL